MNLLSIDTEYSSFFSHDRRKSGDLLQLAIVPYVNGIAEKPFNEFCRPLGNVWSKHAEKVHKISKREAMGFQHPSELAEKLAEFLSRYDDVMFSALGHNHKGDKEYTERLVRDYKLINEWHKRIKINWKDSKTMAQKLKARVPVKNHQLATIAKFFKVEIDAHDALSDARAAAEIYMLMDAMESAKGGRQVSVGGSMTEFDKRRKYLDLKYVEFGNSNLGLKDDGRYVHITEFTLRDREALRVVLDEIWSTYGEI